MKFGVKKLKALLYLMARNFFPHTAHQCDRGADGWTGRQTERL